MGCRLILLEYREERQKKIEEDQQFFLIKCTHLDKEYCEARIKLLHSLLCLELPYQTDTVSLHKALVASFLKPPKKFRSVEKWLLSRFPCTNVPIEDYDNDLKRLTMLKLFKKNWPQIPTKLKLYPMKNEKPITVTASEEEIEMIKQKYELDGKINAEIIVSKYASFEEFKFDYIQSFFFESIQLSKEYEPSTLKNYKSNFNKMLQFCRHENNTENIILKGASASTLAQYFEYLETRCLKSHLENTYKDLIEIRLLFYAKSYAKELDQVTIQDIDEEKNLVLTKEKNQIPVPATFVRLAKSLFKSNEPLLKRNTKQLNKFVSQTASAAKIKEKLNPTLITRSLEWICYTEQIFSDKLPRR